MVDGTGLENRHTLTGIGGSNPSLSASYNFLPRFLACSPLCFLNALPYLKTPQRHLEKRFLLDKFVSIVAL